MNWKAFYRREIEQQETRRKLEDWLRAPGRASDRLAALGRGILSFPHTALAYAGPLQAQVVRAIYESGVERILALGVVHGSFVAPICRARDEHVESGLRHRAFLEVRGGLGVAESSLSTPLGEVPAWGAAECAELFRIDRNRLLKDEFSLDTFAAVCRAAADLHGCRPIPVFPLYVGLTRDPISGRFEAAAEMAAWLREVVPPSTAVVTTGDLVHYGTAYGLPREEAGVAAAAPVEELEARFREDVECTLHTALTDRDMAEAYERSARLLQSDQREILPLIAERLGHGAGFDLFSFALSDYSEILSSPQPCLVASALVGYWDGAGETNGIEAPPQGAYPA